MSVDLPSVRDRAQGAARHLRRMPVSARLAHLRRLKEVILECQEPIIDALQKDTGKSRSDALMSEIFPALDHLQFLYTHGEKILADHKVPTSIAMLGKSSKIFYEPLGVILVITPWNYPFYQALAPTAAAFAAGNATLHKPSEHTPLTGLMEDLWKRAGFEDEWVQVVYGDGATGAQLVDLKPQKIFFTGSGRTGRKLLAQAAPHLIPVELELGGKDPMVVFADVNLERAVAGALWGAMTNAGQSCTSVERLYVQESIYDAFKERLVDEAERRVLGTDPQGDADYGPMTTDFQVEIVARQVKEAVQKGALQLTGKDWDFKSRLIPPIILEGVTRDMEIYQEETFGPVLCLYSFETEADAIRLSNDSPYGLSASVWSKDKTRALRVSRALDTGNVSVNNVMLSEGNHALPFGGVKESGFGRYKGEMGLHAFCNVKSVLVDSDSGKIEANWYPYTREKYRLFSQMMAGLFRGGVGGLVKFAAAGLPLEGLANKLWKKPRGR